MEQILQHSISLHISLQLRSSFFSRFHCVVTRLARHHGTPRYMRQTTSVMQLCRGLVCAAGESVHRTLLVFRSLRYRCVAMYSYCATRTAARSFIFFFCFSLLLYPTVPGSGGIENLKNVEINWHQRNHSAVES